MKTVMLGAASLLALGLAACAKKDDAAPAAETAAVETAETAEIVEGEAAATAEAVEETTHEGHDMAADAVDAMPLDPIATLAAARNMEAVEVAAAALFAGADSDVDGVLNPSEFLALAGMLAPAEPVEGVIAETVDAVEGADAADVAAEVAAPAVGVDALFAEIAGADAALTADDLKVALVTRFGTADVNADGALDDVEAAEFARLATFGL